MRRTTLLFALLMTCGLLASRASAYPILTLSSSTDLANLTVGQEFQVDVRLSGLEVGTEFIFILNSKVLFDGLLLDPIGALSATFGGDSVFQVVASVPQVDRFNAMSSLTDGVATGNFQDFPDSAAINSNGVYYSFTLKAAGVGSGTIGFDAAGTTYFSLLTNQTNPNSLVAMATGDPLQYNILAAAVPEPSALAMSASGVLLCGAYWLRSRRKR